MGPAGLDEGFPELQPPIGRHIDLK
jgi:hypothetical protein